MTNKTNRRSAGWLLAQQITLKQQKTPWAECYSGSNRYTGRLEAEPGHQANDEVAPGWTYVGGMTEAEFVVALVKQAHDHCHTSVRTVWHCPHCIAAGWAEE